MQFSILKAAVATLAICSDVVLGQTAGTAIVSDLRTLSQQSRTLLEDARSISPVNFLVGAGQKAILDFKTIVTTGTEVQSKWSEVTDTAEADAVANAYKEFADMHKAALDVLAGKAGIIGQVLGGPVAAILRLDEGVIDQITFRLIDLVKVHADDIKQAEGPLSESILKCMEAYQGANLKMVKRGSAAFRESLRV